MIKKLHKTKWNSASHSWVSPQYQLLLMGCNLLVFLGPSTQQNWRPHRSMTIDRHMLLAYIL